MSGRQETSRTIFNGVFDLWLPLGVFVVAPVVFAAMALRAPAVALVALAVFFLGLVPQAKMKRADLLLALAERFGEFAGDKDALRGADDQHAGDPDGKRAYAFFLRFWNLQLLEFGLWRYGMLPSDTYAHWIVRRLLSFRPTNLERFWNKSPLDGWTLVKGEFVGSDFRRFIEAAVEIGERVQGDIDGGAPTATGWTDEQLERAYEQMHLRIERLLIAAGGGGLWSSFIVRWFSLRRPDLLAQSAAALADNAEKPLPREEAATRIAASVGTAALCVAAGVVGLAVQPALDQWLGGGGPRPSWLQAGPEQATILLDPDLGPFSTFVVRFTEEGSCASGEDPRRWVGAAPGASSRRFLEELAADLASCASEREPVAVEVLGFASSSQFARADACGPRIADSRAANLALANARAANVAALLQRRLPEAAVTVRTWNEASQMEAERLFVDTVVGNAYSRSRGALNRRAEIRVVKPGECGAS